MIHYDELAKRAEKLKSGENIMLKVDGMLSPGRDRDGEALPPPVANGMLVKVISVQADGVTVATAQGKKLAFTHGTGARKLELTALTDFPKTDGK